MTHASIKNISIITPLWYQVYNHTLSFNEFIERYKDDKFPEREVLPIFVLVVLYEHKNPYIAGSHILNIFMSDNTIHEKCLKYFYLYWSLGKSYNNDLISIDNPMGGTFRQVDLKLPLEFGDEYIYDWISIMLRSFFNIGPIMPPEIKYQRGNMESLTESLRYVERIQEERFDVPHKSADKMFKLARAHQILVELKEFFLGRKFPSILRPYRSDKDFFQSVVNCYWPAVLKTIEVEKPFTVEEIEIINNAHRKLYESGDIEFVLQYFDLFMKIFNKSNSLINEIKKYIEPSAENDQLRADQFLRSHTPFDRRKYLPQHIPVSDQQVTTFTNDIKRFGIVVALKPYLLTNKKLIEEEILRSNCKLNTPMTMTTQTSIFMYSWEELIFYIDGLNIYVFLREELANIKDKKNPYNRQTIPDYIFTLADHNYKSETIEEKWSKILRHNIDLQSIFTDNKSSTK